MGEQLGVRWLVAATPLKQLSPTLKPHPPPARRLDSTPHHHHPGAYAGLLVFRNPYIYAVLTVATILPQNSNVTSLNNLILLFYESGLFQNFGEAVNCVRLVTWLSMGFMVASFALFK